jgi:hypothetical protein
VGALTLLLLCLPGAAVEAIQEALKTFLPDMASATDGPGMGDKLVHALLFCLWALSVRRGWPHTCPWVTMVLLTAAGVGTEAIQYWVPGRTTSAGDVVADALGALLGVMVAALPERLVRSRA